MIDGHIQSCEALIVIAMLEGCDWWTHSVLWSSDRYSNARGLWLKDTFSLVKLWSLQQCCDWWTHSVLWSSDRYSNARGLWLMDTFSLVKLWSLQQCKRAVIDGHIQSCEALIIIAMLEGCDWWTHSVLWSSDRYSNARGLWLMDTFSLVKLWSL